MNQLNDIDKIFKDALDGRREAVSSDIWKTVDNSLNRKSDARMKTKYNRLKGLLKIFGTFIFLSAIYLVYLSPTKESAVKKQRSVFAPGLRSFETNPTSTFSKIPKGHSFEQDKNLSPTDNLLAERLLIPQNLTENKIGSLPGHRQKINYPGAAIVSVTTPTRLQSSFTKGKRLSPDKANTGSDYISHNRKTATFNRHTDNQPNRSLLSKYASATKKERIAKTIRVDALLKENPVPSLFADSIQPVPFNDRFEGIKVLSVNTQHPLSLQSSLFQRQPHKIGTSHAISITPFGSINYSFRHLVDEKRLAGRGFDKDDAERSEQRGSSSSAGILVDYGLRKNFFLQTGLVFSSVETKTTAGKIFARPDNNGRTKYEFVSALGYSYLESQSAALPNAGDSISVSGSRSIIDYVSLPLSINYAWQYGKFLLKPGIGLSVNFLTHNRSSIGFSNSAGQHTEITAIAGLNNIYLDGLFGLGVEYKLTQKLSLEIRPLARFGLTAINNETPVRTFQNYLNLGAGLKIKL